MVEQRNGNAGGGGNAYKINLNALSRRLQSLYLHWRENRDQLWGFADVLTIAIPPASEDLRYLKSSALNIWLLDYEFPETIMVLQTKQMHFLCTQKKASLLDVVRKTAKATVSTDVIMHVKAKGVDGTAQMDGILHALRAQPNAERGS